MTTTEARAPRRRVGVRRLLVTRLCLVLIPIILLQLWVYQHDYRVKRDAELQANLEVARAVAASFDAFVDDLRREEQAIGQGLFLLAPFTQQQAAWYMRQVKEAYPEVSLASWLKPDGRVFASSDRHLAGARWPDRSWLGEIVRGGDFVVTNVTRTSNAADARFTVAHGVRNRTGVLQGIVVFTVDPNRLDRVIRIRRSGSGAVSLVDSSGWLAFRLPALELDYRERNWAREYRVVRRALAGAEGAEISRPTYQSDLRIVAGAPIPSVGWVGGAGRSLPEVVAPIRAGIAKGASAFVVVAALGVLLATLGARTITTPIERLRRSARAMGAGSSEARVPEAGPAELADLASAFNQMTEQIGEREQALRQERDFTEAVLDTVGALVLVLDREGRISRFNRACEVLTGYAAAAVTGRVFWEFLVPPEELPGVQETWQALRAGDFPNQYDNHWVAKDGSRRLIAWSNTALSDPKGEVEYIIATGVDITERKQAEEALRQARDELEARVDERTRELVATNEALQAEIAERARAEEELRAASLYARSLIEASPDPLVTISPEGTITDVNEATIKVTGVPREALVGTDFSDYFTEPERAREGYRQVFSEGFVTDYPLTIRHQDGTLTDVLYNASVYRDTQGAVLGVFAAARDVTAQRQAAQYARTLIEASPDPLVTISPEGKITDVNEATINVTGVLRERLVGTDFSDYFTEPEKARASYREVFSQGFVTDYPLTIRHQDGTLTDVLYNASLYRDARGEVLGVFAAARDVTAQKQAEEAARLERQRFNNVLEMLPVYVILLTPDYRIPFANRFFRERFGESHGRRCFEYLFKRSEPCEDCETYTVLKTSAPHHWEWTGPDGRNYDISDFPFTDVDGTPLILEVGLDVTERKRAEQELRQRESALAAERVRVEMAETLSREISHRVKNNLAMIAGLLQMQMAEQRNPEVEATLRDTTLRIFAFSSLHDQMHSAPGEDADVLGIVERIASITASVFAFQNVSIAVEGEAAYYPRRAATNLAVMANELVTNAIKHGTPEGGSELEVRVSIGQVDGSLRLAVWNSGNSVPTDFDVTRQRGLGLRLVRNLAVEQYGGAFTLRPQDGGSLAEVIIPNERLA